MALSGNWSTPGRPRKTKRPTLRAAVKHGDVIHLPGQPVPERYSRRKIAALERARYLDHGD